MLRIIKVGSPFPFRVPSFCPSIEYHSEDQTVVALQPRLTPAEVAAFGNGEGRIGIMGYKHLVVVSLRIEGFVGGTWMDATAAWMTPNPRHETPPTPGRANHLLMPFFLVDEHGICRAARASTLSPHATATLIGLCKRANDLGPISQSAMFTEVDEFRNRYSTSKAAYRASAATCRLGA